VSAGGDYRADLLSLEEAICRVGDRSGPAAEAASRGNGKLKKLVAELSLDKAMLHPSSQSSQVLFCGVVLDKTRTRGW
jgi:hypothetical protein